MIPISIGITTRDRAASLGRCLSSIGTVLGDAHDVMVFDDASEVPAAEQLEGERFGLRLRFIRDERRPGYIVGRNEMVRGAQHPLVLLLDDDTVMLEAAGLASAVGVLSGDPAVAAIAFAQAEADGRPWPERMQPGRGTGPCYVPSFIGFAHLLRRDVFLSLGGYRESFVFYGEEKEYCLRLLAAGHRVVYLPEARIAHVPDPRGRDHRRYVRYAIRNDCLTALYNAPGPLVPLNLLLCARRFRNMAAGIPGGDPGGIAWIVSEVRQALPDIGRGRRPISWRAFGQWRRFARTTVPYRARGASRLA